MIKKVIGFFIIITGILLFLSNIDMLEFNEMMKYIWPSLLILIGLIGMVERRRVDIFYLIVTILGISFFISNIGLVEKDVLSIVLFPTIIIIIGIKILSKNVLKPRISNNQKSYTSIFGGIEEKNDDKNFTKCDITAIFGGSNIDFREIKIKEDKAYIDVVAIFGGAELILPEGYKVTLNGIPIFGGVDNKLLKNDSESKKEIIINYTVIFGGMDIKN